VNSALNIHISVNIEAAVCIQTFNPNPVMCVLNNVWYSRKSSTNCGK